MPNQPGTMVAPTGPLCGGADHRALSIVMPQVGPYAFGRDEIACRGADSKPRDGCVNDLFIVCGGGASGHRAGVGRAREVRAAGQVPRMGAVANLGEEVSATC